MSNELVCPVCKTRTMGKKAKTCRACSKRLWSHKTGNTKHPMKFKSEYEPLVHKVQELAKKWYNTSKIARELNVGEGVVAAIAKEKGIEIKKGFQPETLLKIKEFERLLLEGLSIKKAANMVNIRPGLAYCHAKSLGYNTIPQGEASRLDSGTIANRLNPDLTVVGTRPIDGRLRYEVLCKKCGKLSLKDPSYLGLGCRHCGDNSKTENSIKDWVESFGLKTIKLQMSELDNNQTKYKGSREIDIYVPSLKIGIEYCGLNWHNDEKRPINYHYNKMKRANALGIRLVTIFESEWLSREFQCKNMLKAILGVSSKKIFARKCEISEISLSEAKDFLNQNHIQGQGTPIRGFGLTMNGELIACSTIGYHPRNKAQMTLQRLCFKDDYSVIGGSAKLIRAIAENAKAMGVSELISWSDNRWSEGRVYKNNGFTIRLQKWAENDYREESRPDYMYVAKGKKLVSKQSSTKKNLIKKGASGKSESDMATSIGYQKIYDCGKKTWVLHLK